MQIQTKYLGELNIVDGDIIEFPNGLMGFENRTKFVLLNIPDNPYFKVLQDVEDSFIGFLVTNPWEFYSDYDIIIPDEEIIRLEIQGEKDFMIYNIITVKASFKDSTVNLMAPVIINKNKNIGKQIIINDSIYHTKHPLLEGNTGEGNVDTK